jgi:hypothetical protein
MKSKKIQYLITLTALSLALIHLIWPMIRIDTITLTLFVISILPWLSSLFKSIELPGGLKVQYQDLEKIEDRAIQSGLITTEIDKIDESYSFQTVASKDPNLALAGLRIELEKRLMHLASTRHLPINKKGLHALLEVLNHNELINGSEKALLSDLVALLNSAVHGATVDSSALDWALEIGPKILNALEARSQSSEIKYRGIT